MNEVPLQGFRSLQGKTEPGRTNFVTHNQHFRAGTTWPKWKLRLLTREATNHVLHPPGYLAHKKTPPGPPVHSISATLQRYLAHQKRPPLLRPP